MISTQESLKTIVFLLLVFLLTSCDFSYNDAYNSIEYIKIPKEESISIDSVVSKFQNPNNVLQAKEERMYFRLTDSVIWYKVNLNKYRHEDVFVTLRDNYTDKGQAILKEGDRYIRLSDFEYSKRFFVDDIFYKSPTWYISKSPIMGVEKPHVLYLKITPHKWRNRREIFIQNRNQFLRRVEIEYAAVGLYVSFMLCLILVLSIFAVIKKEYSILFYALFICTIVLEFISLKGVGQQFFWGRNGFLMNTISLLYLLMAMWQAFFVAYFYKFTKRSDVFRKIALYLAWSFILIIGLCICNYYYPISKHFFNVIIVFLKALALFFTVVHIVLLLEKSLPLYVAILFLISTFSHFIFSQINPSVQIPLEYNYFIYNLRPLLISLEMICVTRFIFDSVIKSQRQNHTLKQINKELRMDFQMNLVEVQTKERNELLGNVHDSFGGYLEALKIRLSLSPSPEKLQEILDSFYKEYRILLNNIYSPKVDSDNFKQYLIEYLEKIERLGVLKISYEINLGNRKLSREVSMHLYRIVSEVYTNILKHSKATHSKLNISVSNLDQLKLTIEDNGVGFDQEVKGGNSYGLKSLQDRVSKIDGILTIDSEVKKGTIIRVVV